MDYLGSLPGDTSCWKAAIESLEDKVRWDLGQWLVREWAEGRLEPRLLSAKSSDDAAVCTLRRHLADAVEAVGEADALTLEWGGPGASETMARRWCWILPWILSQDEDLFLMRSDLVVPLLEEAAAGCPKRGYVLGIVEHHVRDQVHASLRDGSHAVRAKIRELVGFVSPAQAAGATSLATYLNRLQGYERPHKVSQEEALQRVSDFWRCHPPESVQLEAFARGQWRAAFTGTSGREEWIVIDSKTGAMSLEAPWQDRAKKKGRHAR